MAALHDSAGTGSVAGAGAAPDVALVVPLDLSRRPLNLLRRLKALVGSPWPAGCRQIVIAHTDYGSRWDQHLRDWVRLQRAHRGEALRHVPIERRPSESGIPLARLRNAGTAATTTRDVVFADVDLLFGHDLLVRAAALRDRQGWPHLPLPFLYLPADAPASLAKLAHAGADLQPLLDALVQAPGGPRLDGFAVNSSLMLVDRDHVLAIGGFDEGYSGHGFEDYDLLMRLAAPHLPVPLPAAALRNEPARGATEAVGFRSVLSRLALPAVADGLFALHVHHWRPKGDGYFEARQPNYERFAGRLQQLGIVSASDDRGLACDAADTAALFERALDGAGALVRALPWGERPQAPAPSLRRALRSKTATALERLAVRLGGPAR